MPIVQVPSSYGFRPVAAVNLPVRGRVSPVRRRLFDDAEELDNRQTVERQLAQLQLEQTQYWNFDFENGVPLAGRFIWERPSHPLPPPSAIKRPIDSQQSVSNKQQKMDNYDALNNNRCQTKITDFMKNQKSTETTTKRRHESANNRAAAL